MSNKVQGADGIDDERRLLAAVRAGDRQAANQLVDATYGQVFASLMRLCGGRRDLAADLTQETYQKAWKSLGRFDGRSRLATWLYRIAYNTFLNHIRRPRRVELSEDEGLPGDGGLPDVPDPSPDAAAQLGQQEDQERLRRAVMALPETLRFTVTARFWGEHSVADIARAEQVTGAAVRKRLAKAMSDLRQWLKEDAS